MSDAASQLETYYLINGKEHDRLPYLGISTCPDCAVAFSQLHVPGCDKEICPACGRQCISCDCNYEGEQDE